MNKGQRVSEGVGRRRRTMVGFVSFAADSRDMILCWRQRLRVEEVPIDALSWEKEWFNLYRRKFGSALC